MVSTSVSKPLATIGLLCFSSMASLRVCDPMLGVISTNLSVTTSVAAQAISWYALAYGVMQLVYGPIGEKFGKIKVVQIVGLSCAILSWVCALTTAFPTFIFARVLTGALAAAIIPLSMAWVGDLVAYENRQKVLAQLLVATVSGMMAGQLFGGYLSEHMSWRWAFALNGCLFATGFTRLIASKAIGKHFRNSPDPQTKSLSHYALASAALLQDRKIVLVLLIALLEGVFALAPLGLAPTLLVQRYSLSVTTAGATMMLYGVGGLIYAIGAQRWIVALGQRGLAIFGGLQISIALALLGFFTSVPVALAANVLWGAGFYMLHGTMQVVATQMAPNYRANAVALFVSVLFTGQGLGIYLITSAQSLADLNDLYVGVAGGGLAVGFIVAGLVLPKGVRSRA